MRKKINIKLEINMRVKNQAEINMRVKNQAEKKQVFKEKEVIRNKVKYI